MAPDLVADFVATVHAPEFSVPKGGRIIMRPDVIACVTEAYRVDIPLDQVEDVGVGTVPEEFQQHFDDSITIAYRNDNSLDTVILEARAESMERFRTILYKCLLVGTDVSVRYPANRGGRELDTTYVPGKIDLGSGYLAVRTKGGSVRIELDRVTKFSKGRSTVDGQTQWVISVGMLEEETVVTAAIAPKEPRVLSLISRYLKLEYTHLYTEITRLDLDSPSLQTLVAIDAGATEIEGMVPDVEDPDEVLSQLTEDGLIQANGAGYRLTRRGQIATKTHLESVNN